MLGSKALEIAIVSLSAPFSFDLLKRFVNVRAASKVPEQTVTAESGTVEQACGQTTGGTTEGPKG